MAQSSWTKAQLDKWVKSFEDADINKQGFLTYSNVVLCLRQNGFKGSHAELKKIFQETDENKDRKINKDEFMGCMSKVPTIDHQAMAMRKAFDILDTDKSGSLTRKELIDATKAGASIDVEAAKISDLLVYLTKEDDDEKINYAEFIRVWSNNKYGDAMYEVFQKIDKDNSGFLDRTELVNAVQADDVLNFKADKIAELLIYLITDQDKKIDYNEFIKVYRQYPEELEKKAE